MKRNFLLFLSIILLGTLQCSKVGAETGYLRFTVPTLGADSLCTTVQTTVPVRGVTLWWARSTGTDSLLTRSSKLFTPGSTDSVFGLQADLAQARTWTEVARRTVTDQH